MTNLSRVRLNIAAVGSVVALSLGALVAAAPAGAQATAESASTIVAEPAESSSTTLVPNTMGQCPTKRLCFWKDAGWMGTVWHKGDDPRDGTWVYVGDDLKDKASSLWNNRATTAAIGKDFDPSKFPASGPNLICLVPHRFEMDLTKLSWQDGSSVNDSISSYNLFLNDTIHCPFLD